MELEPKVTVSQGEGFIEVTDTYFEYLSYLLFFSPRTISYPKGDEARPVTAATANTPFLIERNDSVQSGDF